MKKKDSSLIQIIQDDKKLSKDEAAEFISLANLFLADFTENLSKSSVELADETGLDLDTWRQFLSYPSIKRFIDGFITEQIKKKADTALLSGAGTRDAINVRKAMIEAEGAEDNTRYVILRLPEKVDDLNE